LFTTKIKTITKLIIIYGRRIEKKVHENSGFLFGILLHKIADEKMANFTKFQNKHPLRHDLEKLESCVEQFRRHPVYKVLILKTIIYL